MDSSLFSGMEVFLWLYLYLIFVAIALNSFPQKNVLLRRKTQTILSALGVWLVQALRSPSCGIDILGFMGSGYIGAFHEISSIPFEDVLWGDYEYQSYEHGYTLFCKIVSVISDNEQIFLSIASGCGLILISYIIYKYASNILLAFVIYVSFGLYLFSFSGLRQYLAFSITFFSIYFVLNRKLIPFLVLVLLASTFHKTAIVFLPVYFLYGFKLSFTKGFLGILLVLVLSLFLNNLIVFLTNILFPGNFEYNDDEGGAITMFLVYIAIFLSSFLVGNNEDNCLNFFRWMALLAAACQSLGIISAGSMTRIGYYFTISYCLLFPSVIRKFNLQIRVLITPLMILLFIVFFYLTSKGGYLNVVPYHFYWD